MNEDPIVTSEVTYVSLFFTHLLHHIIGLHFCALTASYYEWSVLLRIYCAVL
jgi:hypothetical protein